MSKRPTFEQAKAQYVNRFTMEHVPPQARTRPIDHGGTIAKYYAPQYRSDAEWYANTVFPGEPEHIDALGTDCMSRNQTWPLGQWLETPYGVDSLASAHCDGHIEFDPDCLECSDALVAKRGW